MRRLVDFSDEKKLYRSNHYTLRDGWDLEVTRRLKKEWRATATAIHVTGLTPHPLYWNIINKLKVRLKFHLVSVTIMTFFTTNIYANQRSRGWREVVKIKVFLGGSTTKMAVGLREADTRKKQFSIYRNVCRRLRARSELPFFIKIKQARNPRENNTSKGMQKSIMQIRNKGRCT